MFTADSIRSYAIANGSDGSNSKTTVKVKKDQTSDGSTWQATLIKSPVSLAQTDIAVAAMSGIALTFNNGPASEKGRTLAGAAARSVVDSAYTLEAPVVVEASVNRVTGNGKAEKTVAVK